MPGLTGFELLEQLDRDVPVVFTTAYDRYALDAFAVNSIDYLLKPIEPERLDRALDKLERFRAGRGPTCASWRARWRASSRRAGSSSGLRLASASARRCSTRRASRTSSPRTS